MKDNYIPCEATIDYWLRYWKAVFNIRDIPIKDDAERGIRNYLSENIVPRIKKIEKELKINQDYEEYFVAKEIKDVKK